MFADEGWHTMELDAACIRNAVDFQEWNIPWVSVILDVTGARRCALRYETTDFDQFPRWEILSFSKHLIE